MTFFENYAKYTSDNYAPENFHTWCAYATLASCTSRQVWLDIGRFRFYANLYIILVGEAGCGKNTAMDRAVDIIRKVGTVTISYSRESKEDFIATMSKAAKEYFDQDGLVQFQTPFLIHANELAQWLSIDAIGMTDIWVSLYDEREDFICGTRKHGKEIVYRPYINILAGVQPDKLARYVSSEILSTGFLRRTNFIRAGLTRQRKAILEIPPESISGFKACVSHGLSVSQLRGKMDIDKDAVDWYINWFENRITSKNPLISQYDENCHVQIIKLAMLTALGNRLEMRVKREDFERALELVNQVKVELPNTLSGISRNQLAPVTTVLEATLRDAGGFMTMRDIRIAMWSHVKQDELNEILSHLQSIGRIRLVSTKNQAGLPIQGIELCS